MEPVGSNWSKILCTLVANPGPETRLTPKQPFLRCGPIPDAHSGQAGLSSWTEKSQSSRYWSEGCAQAENITQTRWHLWQALKASGGQVMPKGPNMVDMVQSPSEQAIPGPSSFASWPASPGPRAAGGQGKPGQNWGSASTHTHTHTHTHRTPYPNAGTHRWLHVCITHSDTLLSNSTPAIAQETTGAQCGVVWRKPRSPMPRVSARAGGIKIFEETLSHTPHGVPSCLPAGPTKPAPCTRPSDPSSPGPQGLTSVPTEGSRSATVGH